MTPARASFGLQPHPAGSRSRVAALAPLRRVHRSPDATLFRPILRGARRRGLRKSGSAWRHANVEPPKSGVPGRTASEIAWRNRPARGHTLTRKGPAQAPPSWEASRPRCPGGSDSRRNANRQLRHAPAVLHGHHLIRRPSSHAGRAGSRAPPPRSPGTACYGPPVQPDRLARLCRSGSHRHLEHRRRAGQDHRKLPDDADRQARRGTGAGCHGLLARPLAQHRRACGLRRRDPHLRAGCPVSRHPAGRLSPSSQGRPWAARDCHPTLGQSRSSRARMAASLISGCLVAVSSVTPRSDASSRRCASAPARSGSASSAW